MFQSVKSKNQTNGGSSDHAYHMESSSSDLERQGDVALISQATHVTVHKKYQTLEKKLGNSNCCKTHQDKSSS